MCSVCTVRFSNIWLPRKYLAFLLVALAVLLSQGFLAYSLYGLPDSFKYTRESSQIQAGRKNSITAPSHLEKQNRSITKFSTTALPFTPECPIKEADVISALNRATTLECKKQIVDIHCAQVKGALYPDKLFSTCPRNSESELVGCFKYSKVASTHHPQHYVNSSLEQSPVAYEDSTSCVWACFGLGSPYAVFTASSQRCLCWNSSLDEWKQSETCSTCDSCDQVFRTGLPLETHRNQLVQGGQEDSNKRARVVFLLTINGRSFRQVSRLIAALKNTSKVNHYFFVHVDERQDYLYRSIKKMEDPSWFVVSTKRFSTIWGGATLLQMLLACFETILSIPNWHWDYVLNLSESDFPLKRVEVLERFLHSNLGLNFVRSHGQDTARFISKQALKKTFHECEKRMWKIGDRELPSGIRFDGGSDWTGLNRDFVAWLIRNRYSDPMLEGLERVYRQTLLPAESYFHTVLQNSVYCTKFVDNNLRFVNWRRKQGCKCQYKHIVDWCGCSPNVFLEDDQSHLTSLQKKIVFFARKFEPVISQSVINFVEQQIGIKPKTSTHTESLALYWQNDFHHLDRSPPADQGRLSAWTSLARSAIHHISNLGSHCVLRGAKVLEAWLHFKEDDFEGVIVQFEAHAEHIPEPVKSEALFKRVNSFTRPGRFQNDPFVDRLRRLEVSTDYDVKELIFRNFPGVLGPHSEPGVIHEWDAGAQGAVTFVWIDPAHVVAGSYEIKISRAEQIQHHKPPLRKPLRPGIWCLKVFKQWTLMAETSFVVQPQTFYDGLPLKNATVSQFLNGGPKNGYTDADLSTVEKFLGYTRADIDLLLEQADAKSKWTASQLDGWADVLSWPGWLVESFCFVADPLHRTGGVFCPQLPFEPCHYTSWSSLAPDEKSKI